MVVVVMHEPSEMFLGQGFVLVERADALEFESVDAARRLLELHASEPSYVTHDVRAQFAA